MTTEEIDLTAAAKELADTKTKIKKAQERLAKRIKADQDRVKELENQIASVAQVGDNLAGDWHIKVTPSKDLAKDKLAEAYPEEQYPALWKSEILGGRVLDMIGKDAYDAYRIPNGKNTITATYVAED